MGKMEGANMKGTIWATGIHNLWVDGKPGSMYAPQYGIVDLFKIINKKIKKEGGIDIGIDHLDKSILDNNPILEKVLEASKFNPYEVGRIKKVQTDGDRIIATEIDIDNPVIEKLYTEGKLNDFSIVGTFKAGNCQSDKADYVVEEYTGIDRVDIVNNGACKVCEIQGPEMVLTAKLAPITEDKEKIKEAQKMLTMEELDTTEETSEESEEVETSEESEEEESEEEDSEEESEEDKEDESEEEPDETDEPEEETVETKTPEDLIKESESRMLEMMQQLIDGKDKEVKAKLSDLKMEAKRADARVQVREFIKQGLIVPAQEDDATDLAFEQPKVFKEFMANASKIVDYEQHSRFEAEEGEKPTDEEVEAEKDRIALVKYFKQRNLPIPKELEKKED